MRWKEKKRKENGISWWGKLEKLGNFLINLIGEKKTQNDDALERLQKKEEKLTNKRRKKRGASKNNWPLS